MYINLIFNEINIIMNISVNIFFYFSGFVCVFFGVYKLFAIF